MVDENAWRRFWNRGGWWRAFLVAIVYIALYFGIGALLSPGFVSAGLIDPENIFGDPLSIFFGIALPVLLGGVILLAFAASLGWVRELFGPQPIGGRGWMWLAVVLVIVPVIIRLVATDWGSLSTAVVFSALFMGLCVGFTEELLTRGIAVNLLRKAGHGERTVFVLSSLIFALLHSSNVISGQPPLTVAITVIYTFGFGAMMYLALRVTGSLIWPMLLHAATDPTTALATGGIDVATSSSGSAQLISLAALFNYGYVLFAIVAIFLVKNIVAKNTVAKNILAKKQDLA